MNYFYYYIIIRLFYQYFVYPDLLPFTDVSLSQTKHRFMTNRVLLNLINNEISKVINVFITHFFLQSFSFHYERVVYMVKVINALVALWLVIQIEWPISQWIDLAKEAGISTSAIYKHHFNSVDVIESVMSDKPILKCFR